MRGLTDMTPKQFAEVSAIFGDVEPELDVNKRKYKVDEVSSVMRIGNTKDCNGNLNAMLALTPPLPASGSPQYQYAERLPVWHTDSTYRKHPPIGSTLFCRQAPPEGGATCFADMREAYDSLDAAMQERLLGLECVCSQAHHDAKVNRYSPEYPVLSPEQRAANPPNRVPMVLQHPQTGRLALYGMNSSTCAVLPKGTHLSAKQLDQYEVDVLEDASVEEWRKLLPSVTADRFTVTWQWEVGDFVVWDNRCTMHCATGYDTEQHTREMWRTTLAADKV
ncbi:unnamed protein product [Prorocentrum cordatum]|uniref:TauD/TfdA-like domain-containing protein n=1 Tax=Prorocentrum cordatum TaxID=2364126 RepID=A0ABN9VL49_9DINO|nr:unnamed protein product [Polarella glacialis]